MTTKTHPDARLPCIHLGTPKTASTALQSHLFRTHREIAYLGKRGRKIRPGVAHLVRLQQTLRTDRSAWASAAECRREAKPHLDKAADEGRVPFWSQESLTGGSAARRQRCAELFHDIFGPCRILILVREPISFVRSFYFQKLKSFNLKRGSQPSWGRGFGSAPKYFTLNEWLEATWKKPKLKIHGHLRYAETVEIYRSVFGDANVKVFLFEQLEEDDASILEEISRFIGVDPQESTKRFLGKRANERWAEEQIERLKELESSFSLRWRFRLGNWRRREDMLNCADANPTRPAEIEMSLEWRERIRDCTREQNRRLAELTQLPLERYGYVT